MSIHVPEDIGWTLEEDGTGAAILYLARLPRGPISVLQGTAALIWLAATEGPEVTLVERVADEAGVAVDDVRGEVHDFVRGLVDDDLLAR